MVRLDSRKPEAGPICGRATERGMQSIRDFLQKRLKLKVNEEKSSMDRPWKLKYLGFSMHKNGGRVLIRLAPQTIQRVKNRTRKFTPQRKPVSMADRSRRINAYMGGWLGYFALAETPSVIRASTGG